MLLLGGVRNGRAATGFFFFSARDAISREAAVVLSD